jgi:hypothetical protein
MEGLLKKLLAVFTRCDKECLISTMTPPVFHVFNSFQPKIFLTIFKRRIIQHNVHQVNIMGNLNKKSGVADRLGGVRSEMVHFLRFLSPSGHQVFTS